MLPNRKKYYVFGVFNPVNRCVAACSFNRERNYKSDWIGNTGTYNKAGHEVKLKGRRIE